MSYESLNTLDRSVIFRETFANSFSVQNNMYSKGTISTSGIKFENGAAKFDGLNNILTYKLWLPSTSTFRVIFRYDSDISQTLFGNSGSTTFRIYIGITNNLLNCSFSAAAPLFSNIPVKKNTTYELVILPNGNAYLNSNLISGTIFSRSSKYFTIGMGCDASGSSRFKGTIDLFEVYNRTLSASEIKALYQQRLYTHPNELPFILDFDSTRGILEDRTGKNTLTTTNVNIQKIGKVYSAYFNGINSYIKFPIKSSFYSMTISFWINDREISINETILSLSPSTNYYPGFRLIQTIGTGIVFRYDNNIPNVEGSATVPFSIIKHKRFNHYVFNFSETKARSYLNGVNIQNTNFSNITKYNTIDTGTIGIYTNGSSQFIKGYLPKFQIFQGVPDNQDQFASQLYNSQKGQFAL